jgi:uncharacterized protein YcfJ
MKTIALLTFLSLISTGLHAAQFSAHGEVLKVIPIKETTERRIVDGSCASKRPEYDDDLVAILRWDLRADCVVRTQVTETITAYKVFYKWDNRTYDVVMDRPPGKTIPVSVTID